MTFKLWWCKRHFMDSDHPISETRLFLCQLSKSCANQQSVAYSDLAVTCTWLQLESMHSLLLVQHMEHSYEWYLNIRYNLCMYQFLIFDCEQLISMAETCLNVVRHPYSKSHSVTHLIHYHVIIIIIVSKFFATNWRMWLCRRTSGFWRVIGCYFILCNIIIISCCSTYLSIQLCIIYKQQQQLCHRHTSKSLILFIYMMTK